MENRKISRPPLASLACVNPECDLYGEKGRNNLRIRKEYGKDQIRYLRCRACQDEFSLFFAPFQLNRETEDSGKQMSGEEELA